MFNRISPNAIGVCMLALMAAAAHGASPLESVDLLIGVRGLGSCVPGPCLPNGSIHPSPDTTPPGNGGYARGEAPKIIGFSQLHVQGTGGGKSYGNFLITPQIGLTPVQPATPVDEKATASRYQARLNRPDGSSILCEVTPASHSAIYRFTFPKSDKATLTFDAARKLDVAAAINSANISIDPKTGMITGGGRFTRNWNPAPYDVYFAAQVSKPPARFGTWVGNQDQPDVAKATATANTSLGAYLQWMTGDNEAITVKIAVSFVSTEQAVAYLQKEIPDWDFAAVEKAAAARWDQMLSLATLEGASPEEEAKFYTALYHTMVQPRNRTGDNPNWKSDAPFIDDHYTLWDTWRTEFPLMAILRPDLVRDTVLSFIDRHQHNANGLVGTAFVQGKEMHTGQGGDEADMVVADAYVKGIPGIDWEKAYEFLKFDAEKGRTPEYREKGYCSIETLRTSQQLFDSRFRPSSATLAFSYADFCVAQVAKGLGKTDDTQKYLARSGNWKNTWDDSLADAGFKGFPHNRHDTGNFGDTPAQGGWNTDFYEGSCWVYSYSILQDFDGMVAKMGGREKFIERLQYALTHPNTFRAAPMLIDFDNEPSFQTIWWFAAAGRPDLSSYWADKLKALYTKEGYPGDEDDGAMSSLYVFLTAGIFPLAAQDIYYVHGPRVPKITFQVGGGKTFTIIGHNAGPENLYIQSVTLNGHPLEKAVIHHADIINGATIEFVMGKEPSRWGQFK